MLNYVGLSCAQVDMLNLLIYQMILTYWIQLRLILLILYLEAVWIVI